MTIFFNMYVCIEIVWIMIEINLDIKDNHKSNRMKKLDQFIIFGLDNTFVQSIYEERERERERERVQRVGGE